MNRLLVAATVLCVSCGSADPDALDGSKYGRACAAATDCVAVTLHPCGCACAEAAISTSAKAQWQADKNAISCAPVTCSADCAATTVSCAAGACQLSF